MSDGHAQALPLYGDAADHDRAKLGMWLFLASEIMFFGGFISVYIITRMGSPDIAFASQDLLDIKWGAINTGVLIVSSLTMAFAVAASARHDFGKMRMFIGLTFLLACGFLGIKYVEYTSKFSHATFNVEETAEGAIVVTELHDYVIPRTDYSTNPPRPAADQVQVGDVIVAVNGEEPELAEHGEHLSLHLRPFSRVTVERRPDDPIRVGVYPSTNVYFSAYFTMTGFHGLHVIGGMIAMIGLLIGSALGWFTTTRHFAVETTGLYWHFVDIVWIFLFPILYLL